MLVKESKWLPWGERFKPKRYPRYFDREIIDVHAINAA